MAFKKKEKKEVEIVVVKKDPVLKRGTSIVEEGKGKEAQKIKE